MPIVQTARAMGHTVICTNLHENSPAFKFSHFHEIGDITDLECQLNFAVKNRVDAVITDQSDVAVPTVAYVNERLGLPGIGFETALLFTNKARMRELTSVHGDPTPKFAKCTVIEEASGFMEEVGGAIVIKPIASQASRGVYKVNNQKELRDHFHLSQGFSKSREVIVEEFIGGVELTVEGFALEGKHCSLAISRKKHYRQNPMVAKQLYYSPDDPEISYQKLRTQHDRLVGRTGLKFGITHAEYIYSNGIFYLIEMAARGGGTQISSHITPVISGVPTNDWLVRCALNESIKDVIPKASENSFAVLDFFDFNPGKVKGFLGADALRKHPSIIDVHLNLSISEINCPSNDGDRIGFFIAKSNSRDTLDELVDLAHSTITVDYA